MKTGKFAVHDRPKDKPNQPDVPPQQDPDAARKPKQQDDNTRHSHQQDPII